MTTLPHINDLTRALELVKERDLLKRKVDGLDKLITQDGSVYTIGIGFVEIAVNLLTTETFHEVRKVLQNQLNTKIAAIENELQNIGFRL